MTSPNDNPPQHSAITPPQRETGRKSFIGRYWHFGLFLMGLGGLCFLIVEVGPRNILDAFVKLGWGLVFICAFYFIPYFCDALGWRFAFEKLPRSLTSWKLFWIRVAGEAVNNTTWTMDVGGEPVKAALLSRYGIGFPEAMASVIVAKTTMVMAQVIFMLIGMAALLYHAEVPIELTISLFIVTALGVIIVGAFFLVQNRSTYQSLAWVSRKASPQLHKTADFLEQHGGFFTFIAGVAERLRIARKFVATHRADIRELDDRIGGYYQRHHARFAASIGCHLLGWLLGTVEIYVILQLLDVQAGWGEALAIECLHHLVRTVVFWMPMNLGNQEGGNYAIFLAFFDNPELGVAVSLIRRIRELGWAGIGWCVLLVFTQGKLTKQLFSESAEKLEKTSE